MAHGNPLDLMARLNEEKWEKVKRDLCEKYSHDIFGYWIANVNVAKCNRKGIVLKSPYSMDFEQIEDYLGKIHDGCGKYHYNTATILEIL